MNKEKYKKIKKLGKGGNASVWLVETPNNAQYAMKELKQFGNKERKIRKQRFKNEIEIMQKNYRKIKGIMPIIDSSAKESWYIMPVAEPILNYITKNRLDYTKRVDIIISLSKTLAELHNRGLSHRDIKPDNIYYLNGDFFYGDFGLVDIPDNTNDLTKGEKKLGPTFTIAPEMKRDPEHADGKKADIYSLAKTLWIVLTEDVTCFEGQYNFLDKSHSLRNYKELQSIHFVELEELLSQATNNNPYLRPTSDEFYKKLVEWKTIASNQKESQISNWNYINKYLFGSAIPRSTIWDSLDDIVNVLNVITYTGAYSHILFSSKGGNDFLRAEKANEEGFIYIFDLLNQPSVVKPRLLYHEIFKDNPSWNYFYLELEDSKPIFRKNKLGYETLVEDYPANYVSAKDFVYGVYDYDSGRKLPEGSKLVHRYYNGVFLFVPKYGSYNSISNAYDGRHGELTNEKFRNYIQSLIRKDELLTNKGYDEYRVLKCLGKHTSKGEQKAKMEEEIKSDKKIKRLIVNNYKTWNFEPVLMKSGKEESIINFYFTFDMGMLSQESLASIFEGSFIILCKDGFFKENPDYDEIFYIANRKEALAFKEALYDYIAKICDLDYKAEEFVIKNLCHISINIKRFGKPSHLFTCEEIKVKMREGDDRVCNTLVIDENGYAKLINDNSIKDTYPVIVESWSAGNNNLGKYADLSNIEEYYMSALVGWEQHLKSNKRVDECYCSNEFDEKELLSNIQEYYRD